MNLESMLGIELPIIQAPMAGVQDAVLAAAVCNAGGLGSLPCAMLTRDGLRAQIQALQSLTDRPYNVNFFCHTPPAPEPEREAAWRKLLRPYYSEFGIDRDAITPGPTRAPFTHDAADVLSEFHPPVVSFHFGLPDAALLDRVKGMGAAVLACATTVAEAQWLEARGVDAIIAQGLEAGGHRGAFLSEDLSLQAGTVVLVRQIKRAVRLPVIATGGIADAEGVAAALALGAAGVQVGTGYLLCTEATTSSVHRAAVKSEHAHHTAVTNVITGRAARGILNRIMRELGPMNPAAPSFPLASSALTALRAAAERKGMGDFSPLWCGQNATGCREVPAAELTAALAAKL